MNLALATAIAILIAPIAVAGTHSVPEVRDHSNDVDTRRGQTTVGTPEIDILDGWFTSNQTTLGLTIDVNDISHRLQAGEDFGFAWWFDCGPDRFASVVNPTFSPPFASTWIWRNGTFEGGPQGDLTITSAGTHVELSRDLFHCSTLTHEFVSSSLALQPLPGMWVQTGTFYDTAPDSGYGDDYTLQ